MTQQEFESRVKMSVSSEEFSAINTVYMNCELDKDEFCKIWAKMNRSRIVAARVQEAISEREREKKNAAAELVAKLHAITNGNLRHSAINLVSSKEWDLCESIGINLEYKNGYDLAYELGQYAIA